MPLSVVLLIAWVSTLMMVVGLIYGIARAAIHRSDPRDLPRVIEKLGPLLTGIARTLARNSTAGPLPLPPQVEPASEAAPDSDAGAGS